MIFHFEDPGNPTYETFHKILNCFIFVKKINFPTNTHISSCGNDTLNKTFAFFLNGNSEKKNFRIGIKLQLN